MSDNKITLNKDFVLAQAATKGRKPTALSLQQGSGVSYTAVSEWFTGKATPRLPQLLLFLTEGVGLSLTEIADLRVGELLNLPLVELQPDKERPAN